MSVTLRSDWAANLLINYVTRIVTNLEPKLHFLAFGRQDNIPSGYNVLAVPKVNQFTIADAGTISEGTNPTEITWGSTAYTASPTQKGLVVKISDLLIRNSAVETVKNCATEVRNAVARSLDALAQVTVNGSATSAQIIYAGGKASRAALAAGDVCEPSLIAKATTKLRAANAEALEGGYFVGVYHPNVEGDLTQNTSVGGHLGFYTDVNDLKKGEMGHFKGVRFLTSGNVQTFSSSVTVYPTAIFGADAYVWGYYQNPTPMMVATPDSNNPLLLYNTIGMKATLAITRVQEEKIVRIESATNQ